jgi:hypothetical protein
MASEFVDRVSAADDLVIEMQAERWRLIANGSGGQRVLVEARAGHPLRYIGPFAISRRLPDTGALPASQIQRVVLGWSGSDEAWHLGLVLRQELAEVRGSRWCEVAHWPDPDQSAYSEIAQRAGESLAQAVTRPFYLVPPRTEPVTTPRAAGAVSDRALPGLPLRFDIWTMERTPQGVQLVRSGSWARRTVRRVLWYAFWAVVYAVLVYTSLTRDIAPVRPEFLPLLGIFSGVVLVGLILYHLYQLFTRPDRFVADSTTRTLTALRGRSVRWRLIRGEIKAVVVSQVLSKSRKRGEHRPVSHYGELNVQLPGDEFRYMLNTDQAQEYLSPVDEMPKGDHITPLTTRECQTQLQAAALYLAQALNVPCWYDRRA